MSPSLVSVKQIYFALQDELGMMLLACHNDDERMQIKLQLEAARTNYYACLNRAFHDNDPALVALNGQAKVSIAVLRTIEAELGDITKVIADVTQAVSVGAQIAAKVVAV